MQRKFALLILAALAALVVPASAGAAVFPAEHQFELLPTSSKPVIGTSLGTCQITKITGQIPKAPANENAFEIPAPSTGTCTAGTSIVLGGQWKVVAGNFAFNLFSTTSGGVTMRFASLPGCKLVSGLVVLGAVWSNGWTSPSLVKSGYHPHSARGFTWADDGGTCALNGQTELVSYQGPSNQVAEVYGSNDLTSPSTPIIVH
jgi:hypothetical protein